MTSSGRAMCLITGGQIGRKWNTNANTTQINKGAHAMSDDCQGKGLPECDCMVCRSRRHRLSVWLRHNTGQDYPGIRARILAREPRNPDWKRPERTDEK